MPSSGLTWLLFTKMIKGGSIYIGHFKSESAEGKSQAVRNMNQVILLKTGSDTETPHPAGEPHSWAPQEQLMWLGGPSIFILKYSVQKERAFPQSKLDNCFVFKQRTTLKLGSPAWVLLAFPADPARLHRLGLLQKSSPHSHAGFLHAHCPLPLPDLCRTPAETGGYRRGKCPWDLWQSSWRWSHRARQGPGWVEPCTLFLSLPQPQFPD